MIEISRILDALLAAMLLWLAWRLLAARDLFKGVVLFIIFGLVVALVYARLHALDVALAEAAVGAGVTGALFLNALGRLGIQEQPTCASKAVEKAFQTETDEISKTARALRALILLFSMALTGVLGWSIFSLPPAPVDIAGLVGNNLPVSGVTNPVTAVLLNFRGYDTLLETGVLVLAVIAVWSLDSSRFPVTATADGSKSMLLDSLVRVFVPLMIVTGGYLLWQGAYAPGGAFQGGAVVAGALVLLVLTNTDLPASFTGWPLRTLIVFGFVVFLAIGSVVMLDRGQLLAYPPQNAGVLILLIETAITISVALILAALFTGRPDKRI